MIFVSIGLYLAFLGLCYLVYLLPLRVIRMPFGRQKPNAPDDHVYDGGYEHIFSPEVFISLAFVAPAKGILVGRSR